MVGRRTAGRPRRVAGEVTEEPRYVVRSVMGYAIDPSVTGRTGGNLAPPTSYYVLDRVYAWRVVASFDSPAKGGDRRGSSSRRQRAEARAAELNAETA